MAHCFHVLNPYEPDAADCHSVSRCRVSAELPALIFPPLEMLTLFNCYRLLIKELFEAIPRESSCIIK